MLIVDTGFNTRHHTRMARKSGQGQTVTEHYEVLGGIAHISKYKISNDVWQFRMWLPTEKKHYRKSLKTTNYSEAVEIATELALDLRTDNKMGKKIFGITVEELVEKYLEFREKDIGTEQGQITYDTWRSIRSKLQHGINYLGLNTKVTDVKQDAIEDYRHRRNADTKTTSQTINNEQTALNAMWKWGYKHQHTHFEKLDFPKIKLRGKQTFKRHMPTDAEYKRLYTFLREWAPFPHEGGTDFKRMMARDIILVLSNSAMRVGECRQLLWSDLTDYEDKVGENDKVTKVCAINIRSEISKVRTPRRFFFNSRGYFDRLKERSQFTEGHHVIFSMNGKSTLSRVTWSKYWKEIMYGIGIKNYNEIGFNWYSLRHYAITQKIRGGVDVSLLSEIVGTAIKNIQDTYLVVDDEMRRDAALKSYKKRDDGTYEKTIL